MDTNRAKGARTRMTYERDDTIFTPDLSVERAVQDEPAPTAAPVSIVSYNIHLAIGRDRRYEPQRILDVLQEIDADVIGLQEVQLGAGGFDGRQRTRHGARRR